MNPLVSIIMPVYNAERYLAAAIESILQQTYAQFEFIIINDGSKDKSAAIIQNYPDPRIRFFDFHENKGIVHVLNFGLSQATGRYIARMDADDIAFPKRLVKQVEFLESKPDYDIIGTEAELIFDDNPPAGIQLNRFYDTELLRVSTLFYCPFLHPTVMLRANVMRQFSYLEDYIAVEDYKLWTQILAKHKAANLREPLLYVRFHSNSITKHLKKEQQNCLRQVYIDQLEALKLPYTSAELDLHLCIPGSNPKLLRVPELRQLHNWLYKLYTHLAKEQFAEETILQSVFAEVWLRSAQKARQDRLATFWCFLRSPFAQSITSRKKILLCIHCIGQYGLFRPIFNQLSKLSKSGIFARFLR